MKNLESSLSHLAHPSTALSIVISMLAACAALPPPVPPALDPGGDQRALMQISATGAQVYECRAGGANGASAWSFIAPEAQLLDAQGRVVGEHGAGPIWIAADGSRVLDSVQARVDSPDSGAIPWLLLRTRSTGGPGAFAQVTSIQRLNTQGGVPPTSGCSPGKVGAQARVPYRADYRLFSPQQNGGNRWHSRTRSNH
jgi:hypothetical protein